MNYKSLNETYHQMQNGGQPLNEQKINQRFIDKMGKEYIENALQSIDGQSELNAFSEFMGFSANVNDVIGLINASGSDSAEEVADMIRAEPQLVNDFLGKLFNSGAVPMKFTFGKVDNKKLVRIINTFSDDY